VRWAWMTVLLPMGAAAQSLPANLEARLNAHELPPLLALFSADATVELALDADRQRIPNEVWVGRENLETFFSRQTPGLSVAFSDVSSAADHGSWNVQLSNDHFRSLGLEQVSARATAEWLGNRIFKMVIAVAPAQADALAVAIPRANKSAVRRIFDEINQEDFSGLDRQLSPNYVQHSSMPVSPGRAGVKQLYAQLKVAFPDLHVTVEDLIAEGDRVTARMSWRGTQKGEYLGVQPTGRAVVLNKIDIFRFESGVSIEHWDVVDRLGLLQQLGVVPRFPQWNPSLGYDGFR
jgi:predicted ester cyclase